MMKWVAVMVAVILVLFVEGLGEKESPLLSGVIYFVLGGYPLEFSRFILPLGVLVALLLTVRRQVESRILKIIITLLGAVAGWVYFTWFYVPG